MSSLTGVVPYLSVALVIAACGGGFASSGEPASSAPRTTPLPASTIDSITGLPREAPEPEERAFAAGKSEHLCDASEVVVFACTLEGPPPRALTSLCLKRGSPRKNPAVVGRERIDGRTDEPFAGQSKTLMIIRLEEKNVLRSIQLMQVADSGMFGVEKELDPNTPGAPAKYRRSLTRGLGDGATTTSSPCDPALPVTENFDAARAYKLD